MAIVALGVGIKARRTSLLVGMAALVSTVLFAGILWAQPLLAAVEFNFFNVISSPAGVVLEWSTASEANVSGFDVLCKRSDEADTQFHSIGYVPAKGTLGTGALYTFPVTVLEPGAPYCFRLAELTSDGTPGEVQDRCGYGISITPTPQLIGVQPNLVPGATPGVTPTPGGAPAFDPFAATATAQALLFQTGVDPFAATATAQALLFQQGVDPFAATATAQALLFQQGVDPFAATATAQALLFQQGVDPFAATATAQALLIQSGVDPFAATATAQALLIQSGVDPFAATATAQALLQPTVDGFAATATAQALMGYPSPTATLPPAESPTSYPSPQTNTGGASVASVGEPTATMMPPALAAAPTPMINGALALAPDAPQLRTDGVAAVPTPAFIVATASPTQAAAVFGPGMTPLPTVTPTAGFAQLVNLVEPTSQNLMVMLLCMTFTGATGLGVLGLITSIMFMRSRSSQREFYDRHSNRRRY
ncbi:MAG: hypothetical protein KAX65_02775 [Caldilineaceae bacterium]|nr:hypothetical protein [Caldilineaceae bacterium]